MSLLEVDELSVTYRIASGDVPAVRNVSLVLQAGEALRELPHVVVVDQGHRRKCRHSLVERGAADLGAGQVAQELRTVAASKLGQRVELLDQARLHGHTKTNQVVLHPAYTVTPGALPVARLITATNQPSSQS